MWGAFGNSRHGLGLRLRLRMIRGKLRAWSTLNGNMFISQWKPYR